MWRIIVALLIMVGACTVYVSTTGQNIQAQTCGQGVVLRADGSLLIDGWKTYSIVPGPMPIAPPGLPTVTPGDAPTKIVLGASVKDDTPICIETAAGSRCVPLKQIRSLK